MVNLNASVQENVRNLNVELDPLLQDIEVDLSTNIIYAFSPIAKIEPIENGNYLITITDKFGTTTAQIPNLSLETIDGFIEDYLSRNNIIEEYIYAHNISDTAHEDIRNLIANIPIVEASNINGNIRFDNQEVQVYSLPNSVLDQNDVLILNCGDATTEYSF